MVAFDHRHSLDRALRRVGTTSTAALHASLKTLIWRGVQTALPDLPAHADAAILIDHGHPGIVAEAQAANVLVAVALEASGEAELRPTAEPVILAEELESLRGGFGKVLLRWHPADSADRKRRQLDALQRLAELTRCSGARLLLELLLPPSASEPADTAAGPGYEQAILPHRQVAAITEVLAADISPEVWKLEGHTDRAAALAVARTLGSCQPPATVLVLGGGSKIADLGRLFSGGSTIDCFAGFAVGRSIWWRPVADLCRGRITETEARRTVGRNFLSVIDAYEAATSPD